jgi:hypothetical protein
MTTFVLVVFCLVYLGMILGGLPLLSLDRTGGQRYLIRLPVRARSSR